MTVRNKEGIEKARALLAYAAARAILKEQAKQWGNPTADNNHAIVDVDSEEF